MTKPKLPTHSTREDIVADVSGNVHMITANLNSFWHRTAEDLVAGGVKEAFVSETLLTVAIAHKLRTHGASHLIQYLEKAIELLQRVEGTNAQQAAQDAVRH